MNIGPAELTPGTEVQFACSLRPIRVIGKVRHGRIYFRHPRSRRVFLEYPKALLDHIYTREVRSIKRFCLSAADRRRFPQGD